jgi:Xaa-Pro aminopeptidase
VDAFLVTALPNVRYLTGFSGSNGQLVLTTDGGGVFLTDGRYAEQARREAPALRLATYFGELGPPFAKVCADLGAGRVAFESAGLTHALFTELSGFGPELVPTAREVEPLRWVKDPEELANLRAAQEIADRAFEVTIGTLTEGLTERGLALRIDTEMRTQGADGTAFDTIVGFGPSAAEPHHQPTDRQLSWGDVVKIDFGCVVEGYHSDTTRTVWFGEAGGELREVYDLVRRAQQAAIDAIRPGVTGAGADRAARDVIVEAGYGDRFAHGLGHGVGLEIHEGPSLRPSSEDVLPEGTVVTVEPGVYLPGVGGVRIEDAAEVTSDGCRPLPRTPRDLMVLGKRT